MKIFRILFSLLTVTAICGCTQSEFRINGTVAANIPDGQKIYLVPAENATWENVDSTYIHHGRFSFHGTTERVSILRLPIRQRMMAQEMLVVTEPGTIDAYIGRDSHVSGTPQNDLLNHWKDVTISRNTAHMRYFRMVNDSVKAQKDNNIKVSSDSLAMLRNVARHADSLWHAATSSIITHHHGTTLQTFLSKNTGMK